MTKLNHYTYAETKMATKTLFYTKGNVEQQENQTSMGKIRVKSLLKYMSNNIGLRNKLRDILF